LGRLRFELEIVLNRKKIHPVLMGMLYGRREFSFFLRGMSTNELAYFIRGGYRDYC